MAMSVAKIAKIITARQMREGGGFLVRRPIGDASLSELDPFLLLDHMGPSIYGPGEAVGAPDHPHRGFQTVTYAVEGSMQHLDSSGSKGVLKTGGVQWMTAGKGVVHAEMPSDEIMKKGGTVEGFQIWVNLPKKLKMIDPRYQDFSPEKVPIVKLSDGLSFVRIIAGEYKGVSSPVETHMPTLLLDARLEANNSVMLTIPRGMNAMAYCWRGSGHCDSSRLSMGQGAVFEMNSDGEGSLTLQADEKNLFYVLFMAGTPIGEPVCRWGPFVMNTNEELVQAREDYQNGRLGGRIAGEDQRRNQTKAALAMQQKNNSTR